MQDKQLRYGRVIAIRDGYVPCEKGVALITALLVVALVTVVTVAMTTRQQLDIRRTSNILQRDQAYVFTLGGEAFARQVLKKDAQNIDHRGEDWATKLPPFPFKGGVLVFSLDDLSGRFNINNLIDAEGVASPSDMLRLTQLIKVIQDEDEAPDEMKQIVATDLVNAIVDWIDTDTNVKQPGGAEDSDYLEGERPYRTGNRLMVSPSELLLVKGITPLVYRNILPHVTTLPGRTKINVNTATEALVQALFTDITCAKMDDINIRQEGESFQDKIDTQSATIENYDTFDNVDKFMQHDAFSGCEFVGIKPDKPDPKATPVDNPQKKGDVFAVNSEFFLLDAFAEVGPDDHVIRMKLYSFLTRKNGKVTSFMRAQGTY